MLHLAGVHRKRRCTHRGLVSPLDISGPLDNSDNKQPSSPKIFRILLDMYPTIGNVTRTLRRHIINISETNEFT